MAARRARHGGAKRSGHDDAVDVKQRAWTAPGAYHEHFWTLGRGEDEAEVLGQR